MHVFTALNPLISPALLRIASTEIDPAKLRPGWLGGAFAFGAMILVALLMWNFAVMARRARQPWDDDENETSSPTDVGPDDQAKGSPGQR